MCSEFERDVVSELTFVCVYSIELQQTTTYLSCPAQLTCRRCHHVVACPVVSIAVSVTWCHMERSCTQHELHTPVMKYLGH